MSLERRKNQGDAWETVESSGGESLPQVLELTYTAAEIGAAWSEDAYGAAFELALPAGAIWLTTLSRTEENTLNNDVTLKGVYAYTSGSSSANVLGNGDGPYTGSTWLTNPYSYILSAPASMACVRAFAGASLYLVVGNENTYIPPTEGQISVTVLALNP